MYLRRLSSSHELQLRFSRWLEPYALALLKRRFPYVREAAFFPQVYAAADGGNGAHVWLARGLPSCPLYAALFVPPEVYGEDALLSGSLARPSEFHLDKQLKSVDDYYIRPQSAVVARKGLYENARL